MAGNALDGLLRQVNDLKRQIQALQRLDVQPPTNTATIGSAIHDAAEKTTPVDADNMPLTDSAASNVLKRVTWANIKATLKTYFDTIYNLYVHPNHSGDVTSAADGATTIASDAVTNAKLANVATSTIKGRTTAGTGDPEDLTAAQVTAIVSSTSAFIRADGAVQFSGFLGVARTTPTISGGAITATSSYLSVSNEGGAGSDDLDTINGTGDGRIIIVRAASSTETVVIKNATGNIKCPSDRSLTHVDDMWVAMYNGARWCELSFTDNAA